MEKTYDILRLTSAKGQIYLCLSFSKKILDISESKPTAENFWEHWQWAPPAVNTRNLMCILIVLQSSWKSDRRTPQKSQSFLQELALSFRCAFVIKKVSIRYQIPALESLWDMEDIMMFWDMLKRILAIILVSKTWFPEDKLSINFHEKIRKDELWKQLNFG